MTGVQVDELPNEVGMATAFVIETVPTSARLSVGKDIDALDAALDATLKKGLGYLYEAVEERDKAIGLEADQTDVVGEA